MVPGNPVSSRGCNSFSPFGGKRKGYTRGRAWRSALQWELSVRSWDESATQRRKRRGEKTHRHLDRTKAYKCARIRPRGIASFACFKNKGNLLNCRGFVQPCLTYWFVLLLKTDGLYEWKLSTKRRFALLLQVTWDILVKLLCPNNTGVFPCCVCLLLLTQCIVYL